jgi:hypothetical protein
MLDIRTLRILTPVRPFTHSIQRADIDFLGIVNNRTDRASLLFKFRHNNSGKSGIHTEKVFFADMDFYHSPAGFISTSIAFE